ncbi:MAG: hypothetical protein AAFR91_12680 [Pseudomonadota bacterium]
MALDAKSLGIVAASDNVAKLLATEPYDALIAPAFADHFPMQATELEAESLDTAGSHVTLGDRYPGNGRLYDVTCHRPDDTKAQNRISLTLKKHADDLRLFMDADGFAAEYNGQALTAGKTPPTKLILEVLKLDVSAGAEAAFRHYRAALDGATPYRRQPADSPR